MSIRYADISDYPHHPILKDDVYKDADAGAVPQSFVGGGQFNATEGDAQAQPEPLYILRPHRSSGRIVHVGGGAYDIDEWLDTEGDPSI